MADLPARRRLYAIEGAPQPKRRHGRTWADVDREGEFLAGITLGVPPWYREAWRPEHRPTLVTPEQLRDSLSPAVLAYLTAAERAALCA